MPFTATWMETELVIPNEESQTVRACTTWEALKVRDLVLIEKYGLLLMGKRLVLCTSKL